MEIVGHDRRFGILLFSCYDYSAKILKICDLCKFQVCELHFEWDILCRNLGMWRENYNFAGNLVRVKNGGEMLDGEVSVGEAVDGAGKVARGIVGAAGEVAVGTFSDDELASTTGTFPFGDVCADAFGGVFCVLRMLATGGGIGHVG